MAPRGRAQRSRAAVRSLVGALMVVGLISGLPVVAHATPLAMPTCHGLVATIVGTPGHDVIHGTSQDDVIVGLSGGDAIYGEGGADTICGSDGADAIRGGSGKDWLEGGLGRDSIAGGPDDDVLLGQGGPNTLMGGPGTDVCNVGDSGTTQSCEPAPAADLSITKSDGVTSISNGTDTTYTIRVTNNGPNSVTGAILKDPTSPGEAKVTVACSAAPANQCTSPPPNLQLEGAGALLPTLTSGQFFEITIITSVVTTAASVSNTATVATPAGITDPIPGNNSATDTDTVTP